MLYLVKIFTEQTDDRHGLTMQEIIRQLEEYDVTADRKTLYLDFEELRRFGIDIISEKTGRQTFYHLGSRRFELAEVKMLVDSVQAAKFISDSKSKKLIRKLSSLVSNYEARQLSRQVVIAGRVKTDNKTVLNNVNAIYSAIDSGRQITFHYFQWDAAGNPVLRHDGALYQVCPRALMWDDEYYYLVADHPKDACIRHYRVDKIKDLQITEDPSDPSEGETKFDPAVYSGMLFGMFGGEAANVTLECKNEMAGVIIDRFGRDVTRFPHGDTFTVHVHVVPSSQFLGWIIGLGDGVRITGPSEVVRKMEEEIRRLNRQYPGSRS